MSRSRSKEKRDKIVIGVVSFAIMIFELIPCIIIGILKKDTMGGLFPDTQNNPFLDACHQLMAASMSVVFLGISMLNMLTDNKEKIYWRNDSERLMKKRPDFIAWCRIGYAALGLQLVSYLFVIITDAFMSYIAFAIFFVDGLFSIIWLFRMSTAVFSNKEKIQNDMKDVEYSKADEKEKDYYYIRTACNFGEALDNGDADTAADDLIFLFEYCYESDDKKYQEKRERTLIRILDAANYSQKQLLFEAVLERVLEDKSDSFMSIIKQMFKNSKLNVWLGNGVADRFLRDIKSQLEDCDKKYELLLGYKQEQELLKNYFEIEEKLRDKKLSPEIRKQMTGEKEEIENKLSLLGQENDIIKDNIYNDQKGSSGYSFTEYFFSLKDYFLRQEKINYVEKLINLLSDSKMPDFLHFDSEEENGMIKGYRYYSKLTLCIQNAYGEYYDYSFLNDKERKEYFSIIYPIIKKSWTFFINKDIPSYLKNPLKDKVKEELKRIEKDCEHWDSNIEESRDDQERAKYEKKIDDIKPDIRTALNVLFNCLEESEYERIADEYSYLIRVSDFLGEYGELIDELWKNKTAYECSLLKMDCSGKVLKEPRTKKWLKNYYAGECKYYSDLLKDLNNNKME